MNPADDRRLYVPRADTWTVKIKPGFEREYCHSKFPGEDYYHLLVGGELHLDSGEQKLCLTCALRLGLMTTDRQFWQKARNEETLPFMPMADNGDQPPLPAT